MKPKFTLGLPTPNGSFNASIIYIQRDGLEPEGVFNIYGLPLHTSVEEIKENPRLFEKYGKQLQFAERIVEMLNLNVGALEADFSQESLDTVYRWAQNSANRLVEILELRPPTDMIRNEIALLSSRINAVLTKLEAGSSFDQGLRSGPPR